MIARCPAAGSGIPLLLVAAALAAPGAAVSAEGDSPAASAAEPAPEAMASVPLTLSEAAAEALARYPAIAAARARSEAAGRDVDEARAGRFPSVTLSGSAVKYEKPMVVTPIHGFDPSSIPAFDDVLLQGSLTADWLLFDGGGRGARIDRRRSLATAADADVAGTEAAIVGRTLTAYLRVLGLSAKLDAHDRRLAALESEDARVRRMADVGRAAEVDLRRAAAALEAARAERVGIASSLDVAERELARLIGRDAAETRAVRLVGVALADTAAPDRAALLEQALRSSPDLRAAQARVEAADAGLAAGRAERWPSLHAVGNVLGFGSDQESLDTEWNAGVRVQVPLFTGGAISGRIGRSQAERRAAGSDLALARLRVEAGLDAALGAVDEARARTVSLAAAVANYEEVVRIERLRLDTESGTQTDWLAAEAELLGARAQLVDARYAEIVARADLARVAGTLGPGWIDDTLNDHTPEAQ